MPLRYRSMKLEDIPGCIRILAEHPILAPRFGRAIHDLEDALVTVLGLDSVRALTLEEIVPYGQSHLLGAGIIGFVSDEFVASAKTPPFFWIGPEVTRLTLNGKTPFIDNTKLREANSLDGLNNITWLYLVALSPMQRFEVQKLAMDAYLSA